MASSLVRPTATAQAGQGYPSPQKLYREVGVALNDMAGIASQQDWLGPAIQQYGLLVVSMLAAGLFAGFVAGMFGIGGGFVVVPALAAVLTVLPHEGGNEHIMHVAIGTSLATIFFTSLRSVQAHAKRGAVDWTLSGNMSKHRVTNVAPPPAALLIGATGPDPALFSKATVFNFEKSSPEYRFLLSGVWQIGDYTISLKETLNGPATSYALSPVGAVPYLTKLESKFITDLVIAYALNDYWKIAIGADYLFNEYPEQVPDFIRAQQLSLNSNAYATKYSTLSPYGINGGYYYARINYSF